MRYSGMSRLSKMCRGREFWFSPGRLRWGNLSLFIYMEIECFFGQLVNGFLKRNRLPGACLEQLVVLPAT